MPPSHISGTSRALYRVFVAPNLRFPTSIPIFYAPAFASPSPSPSLTSRTQTRGKKLTKDVARHALTDHYILDKAIETPRINLVDEDGTFYPNVSLADVLYDMDKTRNHLVQLTPAKLDEFGRYDPDDLPTCRITNKIHLREQHERKLDIARRNAKGLGAGPAPKMLELNWAIAGGDLKHRLGRLKDFLLEGRKVELLLGPKYRGRGATQEEAEGMLEAVRAAVAECKGKEVKCEGVVGGVMKIVFEGEKTKKQKSKGKGKEKEKDEGSVEEASEGGSEQSTGESAAGADGR
jgi:translation initiation factor IF-3